MSKFEFCQCGNRTSTTTGYDDEWGYWDVCIDCGKRIEDGYHSYNHYDGEDHEVFMDINGNIID